MKTTILSLAAVAMASTASANNALTFNSGAEYSVEGDSFEASVGSTYSLDYFDLTADLLFIKPTASDIQFEAASLGVTYYVNSSVDVYGKVKFDDQLDYSDTVVGVNFTF